MAYNPASREAQMGAEAEADVARIIQRRGGMVLPVFSLLGNVEGVKAPLILMPLHGRAVGPDLCVFTRGRNCWIDVKGKASPTWHYTHPARWEHGVDYAHFLDYEAVGARSGLPVWLLIVESRGPVDPTRDAGLDERCAHRLAIRLTDARRLGEHRPRWPRPPRELGANGMGGWLWPRSVMTEWAADTDSEEAAK
jgi:hypothetical protein